MAAENRPGAIAVATPTNPGHVTLKYVAGLALLNFATTTVSPSPSSGPIQRAQHASSITCRKGPGRRRWCRSTHKTGSSSHAPDCARPRRRRHAISVGKHGAFLPPQATRARYDIADADRELCRSADGPAVTIAIEPCGFGLGQQRAVHRSVASTKGMSIRRVSGGGLLGICGH